jgi:hypothetical protein
LDRIIERSNTSEEEQYFAYRLGNVAGSKTEQAKNVEARLFFLQKAGLANPATAGVWNVRSDFMSVLKAMQQVADRQRSLAAHRALVSDERLPLVMTEPRDIKHLEGRVLGHGEDEGGKTFGKQYMLLEGTDAKIHLIYHTPEMQEARSRRQLTPNSFIKLQKHFENGRPRLHAENLGHSEDLLKNRSYFRRTASLGLRAGVGLSDESLGGWLGRYREELKSARQAISQQQRKPTER